MLHIELNGTFGGESGRPECGETQTVNSASEVSWGNKDSTTNE